MRETEDLKTRKDILVSEVIESIKRFNDDTGVSVCHFNVKFMQCNPLGHANSYVPGLVDIKIDTGCEVLG